jgi:hypothetical protein
MENAFLTTMQRRNKERQEWDNAQDKAINKAIDDNYKFLQTKIKENELTRESIRLYQQELNAKIKNNQTTYGKHLSPIGVESIKNQASL